MARHQYESDVAWNEARRKVKPHFKVHHSLQNHPKTTAVYADNDLLAAWLRLGLLASERGAAHTSDRVTLSRADVERTSGKRRADVALTLLERLANVMRWSLERHGDVVAIHFRNLARKQGLTPRKARNLDADSASLRDPPLSPLPTPHTTKEDSVPSERRTPASPPDRRPLETESSEIGLRPSPPVPKDLAFSIGIPLLVAAGTKEPSARAFLGRQLADYGDALLAEVLAAAVVEKPVDPKAWLVATLASRKHRGSNGSSSRTRNAVDWDAEARRADAHQRE